MLRLSSEEFIREGYVADLAESGEEALRIAQISNPDVVVADLKLSGMSGLEFIERLLALRRSTRIIIHTGYPSYRQDSRSWAADAFVAKSSNLDPLKGVVHSLLAKEQPASAEARDAAVSG